MTMLRDDEVERILVVTAHPDDVDFGAAGSVAHWTKAGVEVSYCICTDGDAGGFDPSVPRDEIPVIRRREQTDAAATVGVTDLHWLGFPDGALVVSLELREAIARVIRTVRPRRVVMQGFERTYDSVFRNHPDHLAAGEATICAVYPDARNPFTFTNLHADGLDAWTVEEVLIMGGPDPDAHVDITDTFDTKIAALACHDSQVSDIESMRTRLRNWAAANAQAAGFDDGRLAESFRRLVTG